MDVAVGFGPSRSMGNSWKDLPAEIKLQIFEDFAEQCSKERPESIPIRHPPGLRQQLYSPPSRAPLTQCAAVCRDWKEFFERKIWQYVILKQGDIQLFDQLTQGERRKAVQWIWLRFELPDYDCDECGLPWDEEIFDPIQRELTGAIWDLFSVLSVWEQNQNENCKADLTLELSMHSWSDTEHHFKELRVRANDTAWAMVPKEKRYETRFDDYKHGWVRGSRIRGPSHDELRRIGDSADDLAFDPYGFLAISPKHPKPYVFVVTSLVVRRQFYHGFPWRYLLPIMGMLPNLRSLTYEPVHSTRNRSRESDDMNLLDFAISGPWGQKLKQVSIFQSSHRRIEWVPNIYTLLARARLLGERSQNLEELHAAFFIDASSFFDGYYGDVFGDQQPLRWMGLRCLSLTSELLRGMPIIDGYTKANTLMETAGLAAQRMPQLEVMELWQTSDRSATLFRYKRRSAVDGKPLVELKSSWGLRLHFETEMA